MPSYSLFFANKFGTAIRRLNHKIGKSDVHFVFQKLYSHLVQFLDYVLQSHNIICVCLGMYPVSLEIILLFNRPPKID